MHAVIINHLKNHTLNSTAANFYQNQLIQFVEVIPDCEP